MAWTTPLTAVANTKLDASQWNASVRDNLNLTGPAVASTVGSVLVTAGANLIAARTIKWQLITDIETTTSTSYTDLATVGPKVTVTCGPQAIVWQQCQLGNSSTTNSLMSYAVSGATTDAADSDRAIEWDGNNGAGQYDRWGVTTLQPTTAGVNTFTSEYKVTGGTGTFKRRRIHVMPL